MTNKWYAVDKTGIATLCTDEQDAIATAKESEILYPANAPYRAVQLVESVKHAEPTDAELIEMAIDAMLADDAGGGRIETPFAEDAEISEHILRFARDLLSRYAGQIVSESWQPIETLPTKEGNFLVFMPAERSKHQIQAMCRHPNVTTIGNHFAFDMSPPSHWMPLPPPPETTS